MGSGKVYSYLDHLECGRCNARFAADVVQGLCTVCGSPLLARYDLDRVGANCSPSEFVGRSPDLWRYHELLPVRSPDSKVSFGEGMTPLIPMPGTGSVMGLGRLFMKDEGLLPGGTFKARGAAVGVSRAKELGIKRIAMPTNGNAGAAWAAYAARAGIEALIVMPTDAPSVTRAECALTGAQLFLVDGLISDAGKMVAEAVSARGYSDASTLKEPYRLEGKKTMGLEIFEQLGWRVPDVILYPTGGGVGLIGIYKALLECQQLGWVGDKLPRLVSVQASGCAPIVRAWEDRASESTMWEDASTVAFGITVPKALGDFLILDAIYKTDGCAIAVDDDDLLDAQGVVARNDGAFICPEGAACFAAARSLRASGWLSESDEVLIINTGTGIKYPDTVSVSPPVLQVGDTIPVG
ncbi:MULTISPECIES: threonine synthase [Ferrimicrobium]|uniref:Threonine synthase n=1 Tax=Ferrimicrobium acidiphilum TaxID=121039 RepID=A0ABV3Y5Y8_9ACTN|nr:MULTISPECIES: threonine synthase [Ferrimicrobium]